MGFSPQNSSELQSSSSRGKNVRRIASSINSSVLVQRFSKQEEVRSFRWSTSRDSQVSPYRRCAPLGLRHGKNEEISSLWDEVICHLTSAEPSSPLSGVDMLPASLSSSVCLLIILMIGRISLHRSKVDYRKSEGLFFICVSPYVSCSLVLIRWGVRHFGSLENEQKNGFNNKVSLCFLICLMMKMLMSDDLVTLVVVLLKQDLLSETVMKTFLLISKESEGESYDINFYHKWQTSEHQ